MSDTHSFQSTSDRSAGLEVPLFAIPRDGDLGAGDTACLHQLIDLSSELGLGFLTSLPIQETAKGNNPYSPICQQALEQRPMLFARSTYPP